MTAPGEASTVETGEALARGPAPADELVAGLFTFPFGRMLGAWLFG